MSASSLSALLLACWAPLSVAAAPSAPAPAPAQDLLTQELEEVEALLRLAEERAALVEELRSAVGAGAAGELAPAQVRALTAELPRLSEVAVDAKFMPSAAAEDFLTVKATLRLEEPAALVKFLPVRLTAPTHSASPRGGGPKLAAPGALLVVASKSGKVRFFAPSGEHLLTYEAGHERQLSSLAVSPSWAQGDMLVATGDVAAAVRVHRVVVKPLAGPPRPRRRRRAGDGEDEDDEADFASEQNDSVHFGWTIGSFVNVTAKFKRQLEPLAGAEAASMTALAMASQQGEKFFVIGDTEGKISIFGIDGAFRSRLDATLTPGAAIEHFYVHRGRLMFTAGSEWGFVDLGGQAVRYIECPEFDSGRVASAIIDSQYGSRVLLADDEGAIWAIGVRSARSCRVDHKFRLPAPLGQRRTAAPGPAQVDMASIHGFLLVLERRPPGAAGAEAAAPSAALMALNMSHVGKEESDLPWGVSPVVWRLPRRGVRSWAVFRHRSETPDGDVIALLSEDGREVEIVDLLMHVYTPPPPQPIYLNGWVVIPSFVTTVLSVVGWHYLAYGRPPPPKLPEEGAAGSGGPDAAAAAAAFSGAASGGFEM